MINEKVLIRNLQKLEVKHRDIAEKLSEMNSDSQYQEGFADGVQESINKIVGLLEKIK